MIDPYLLLTPVLMLGVIALLGFVGCWTLYDVDPSIDAPTNLQATAGNAEVSLSWNPSSGAQSYTILRGTITGGPYPVSFAGQTGTTYIDNSVTNGMTYYYVVRAVDSDVTSGNSNESLPATPMAPVIPNNFFVISHALGTPRNNFTGFLGMAIQVGATPVIVKGLGRIFVTGNTGSHQVKIVIAGTSGAGVDLPGATVMIDLPGSGAPANSSFVYANFATPVTLNANTTYYIVSQETSGADQDQWYDDDTTVHTTGVASVTSSVFNAGEPPFTLLTAGAHTYIPVDFIY